MSNDIYSLDLRRRPPPENDGVWQSVSEIARLKGVEKSSISRRIKRLIEQGLIEVRAGPGGQKLVKLAAYDRATGEIADDLTSGSSGALRTQELEPSGRSRGLAREQARRVAYQADIAELDLAEARAKTAAAERVRSAAVHAVEKMVLHIQTIPSVAERVAEAVVRDGERAARTILVNFVDDLRRAIAEDFRPNKSTEISEWRWPMEQGAVAELEADTTTRWQSIRARRA